MPAKRSGARRSFLGVRERPGTVLRRRVAVATWPDGSPLTLPILVATGAPGPALYVQGGLHGDEIVGVEAARQKEDGFAMISCPWRSTVSRT